MRLYDNFRKSTILIVDDNQALEHYFELNPVKIANNGINTLDILRSNIPVNSDNKCNAHGA